MTRRRIFTIIQVGNLEDIPSRAYDISLVVAVAINIFIVLPNILLSLICIHNSPPMLKLLFIPSIL